MTKLKTLPSISPPSPSLQTSSYLWPQAAPWPDFPSSPGVYWFKDGAGTILYLGKAKNLQARLLSYLRWHAGGKTQILLGHVKSVTVKPVDSEFTALLLEAKLINTLKPKYNVTLKDDKSPLYIVFTSEPYPRVLPLRKAQIKNLKFKIENCYGPFPSGYQVKNLLNTLRPIFPFCNLGYKPIGRWPKTPPRPCFYSHLHLCPGACTGLISPPDYRRQLQPLKLLLSGRPQSSLRRLTHFMLQAAVSRQFELAARFRDQIAKLNHLHQIHSDPPDWVNPQALASHPGLRQLHKLLKPYFTSPLPPLQRIEAYDISHLSGLNATASMVVLIQGTKATDQYRRFRITTKHTPDDPFMLQEALTRRLNHPEWDLPDLFLIDGGQLQLSAATAVIGTKIPTLALAKRQEIIFTPKGQLKLAHDSPALHLLQALRDEAHRFARAYHLKLRDTIS